MAKRFTDADLARIRNANGENIPVPKERKKPSNEESRMQCEVIRWWSAMHRSLGCMEIQLFAIPNGHKRDIITAATLKREGLRAGVSDLMLAAPRRGFHGLFVELKCKGGVVSPAQSVFQCVASGEGYCVNTCYSFDDAVASITRYTLGK